MSLVTFNWVFSSVCTLELGNVWTRDICIFYNAYVISHPNFPEINEEFLGVVICA